MTLRRCVRTHGDRAAPDTSHDRRKSMPSATETVQQFGTKLAPQAPVMLLPDFVERMIAARQAAQIVKFRTTCTDCVPNW
jgi:hypothetical protein